MNLVLTIRVLASMDVQQFVVPLDLTGPATLTIRPGEFGIGHRIGILDAALELRCWYASELIGLQYVPDGGEAENFGPGGEDGKTGGVG